MNTKTKTLIEILYKKYDRILISTAEAANETNRSELSLIRDRGNATGLKYVKNSKTTQGRVYYSIEDIAAYIVECTSL